MLYYAKTTAHSKSDAVLNLFSQHSIACDSVILDCSPAPKQINSIFNKLKEILLSSNESLTIDSLNSLGKTKREISKELQWFVEHNIRLIILDLPSTFSNTSSPIQLLSELYAQLAAVEVSNVKEKQAAGIQFSRSQNKPLGRKRIPYPPNWESLYKQWERKEISVSEFMVQTNLKKGTLYNLIKQYKEQEASVLSQKNIG